MKLKNLYIALGLTLLLPALTGCKSDEPVPVVKTEDSVNHAYVSFTLSLSGPETRTDGDGDPFEQDWGTDADETGSEFDDRISKLSAALYAAPNGTLITDFPLGEITSLVYNPTDKKFTGDLKTVLNINQLMDNSNHYILAVYANSTASDITTALDVKNPATATFSHHGIPGENNFNSIPMYGLGEVSFAQSFNNPETTPEEHATAEDALTLKNADGEDLSISMLRSIGQVRIVVDETSTDSKVKDRQVELTSFSISKHNASGYVVPGNWNKIKSVTELGSSIKKSAFNPVGATFAAQTLTSAACTVTPKAAGDTNTDNPNTNKYLTLYIPETINGTADADKIQLTVKYTIDGNKQDEKEHTFYLSLEGDKDKEQFNIYRNCIHEFKIVGVEDNFSLDLEVSIKDWGWHRVETEL